MDDRNQVESLIQAQSDALKRTAKQVWDAAELNWRETKSADALKQYLSEQGFSIKAPVCGMDTAFIAQQTVGSGGPVVAFLAEYDALPGLSQCAAHTTPNAVQEGGAGHGCGHNLLGAGAAGAAAALVNALKARGLSAVVRCYGCPAEEDGGGKVFFAREGAFDDVQAVFAWHPGDANYVLGQGTLAVTGVLYRFSGITAHAAAAPHTGRSALDACELMNVGCNYLREHILPTARLHYAYRDTGGTAPNVVPDRACLHYYVRACKVKDMMEIKKRVDDVARGAALMTGTTLSIEEVDGFSDFIPNRTLSELTAQCLEEIGAPAFDSEDEALAQRFSASFSPEARMANLAVSCHQSGLDANELAQQVLCRQTAPYRHEPHLTEPGSTDVGDVSYCAPTVQLYCSCWALGSGGHNWQVTAQSASSLGEKGMLTAAKVLALAALRAVERPELLAAAEKELKQTCPDGYYCPMPAQAKPHPAP